MEGTQEQAPNNMCLYPKFIRNKKYTATEKNGGVIPPLNDNRVLVIPVGCQKCIECKKQKSRNWQIRLQEEIRSDSSGQMVTLTLSNESYAALSKEITGITGYNLDNEIATLATRRFLERWRKKNKKSVKHWLITELGGNGTENIHLHGIIWNRDKEQIKNTWKYGHVFIGDYVNEKTINYIIKYVNKTDVLHKEYNQKILTSPGIGRNYTNRPDHKKNTYNEKGTKETYTTRQGFKMNMPTYYRNKIYTDEEREKLWIEKLDKEERWVCGERVSIKEEEETYRKLRQYHRERNKRLGYGDGEKDWEKIEYEHKTRWIKQQTRIKKGTAARDGAAKECSYAPEPRGYVGDISNAF